MITTRAFDEKLKALIAKVYDDEWGINLDAEKAMVELVEEAWGIEAAGCLVRAEDCTEDRFYVEPGTGLDVAEAVFAKKGK
jgi:hypothetical protein